MKKRDFLKSAIALSTVFALPKFAAARSLTSGNGSNEMTQVIRKIKDNSRQSVRLSNQFDFKKTYTEKLIPMSCLIAMHGRPGYLTQMASMGGNIASISLDGFSAIKAALLRGSLSITEEAINLGCPMNVRGHQSEIICAVIGGNEECLDLTLSHALPSDDDIYKSLLINKPRAAESLYRLSANPTRTRNTILRMASDSPQIITTINSWQ